jgi:NADH:ubiquinone oxidoreductase subunit 6 (subunit J)
MWTTVLQAGLLVAACFFALLAVELHDILYAVVALLAMSVALGALFWLMAAPYLAVFQLLVYGGAVVALFTVTVTLTGARAERRPGRRLDLVWAMGTITSAALIVIVFSLIQRRPFDIFRYVRFPMIFVEASPTNVIQQVSQFLWKYRSLDVIAQAFVLFTAALGCIALLRPSRGGGTER